ncbi:hypothetical protein [Sulfuriroseicoccus oceanibius]|uniref:Uncharacterized protein n=1 Tax=Sulfuriroseicoccus oceanibius TaxID=2707525 RepID=A0A6B3LAD2_9BACT|nr:hypothetical protein [Sulfuriroseicoccus oceanibius]QQL44123.1 hypothetical protein G3M56_009470 [Sulfuriroseicoccus oceanibius]
MKLRSTVPFDPTPENPKKSWVKYAWPAPLGWACYLGVWAVIHFGGMRAFMATHVFFEVGLVLALIASVHYSIKLAFDGRATAPRWVFFVNLSFGPLIIAILVLRGIHSWLVGG